MIKLNGTFFLEVEVEEEAVELLGFRARRRALAASSAGSSTVSKHEQVCRANLRICVPSSFVD